MSSALVRQALALVDPEENTKNSRRGNNPNRHQGQVSSHPYKKNKKQQQNITKSKKEVTEENIKKLLALSTPSADTATAKKIVERAIKGKPLCERIEIKKEQEKSILFPDEPFEEFEKTYFVG